MWARDQKHFTACFGGDGENGLGESPLEVQTTICTVHFYPAPIKEAQGGLQGGGPPVFLVTTNL